MIDALIFCTKEKLLGRIPYNQASHIMIGDCIEYEGVFRKVVERWWYIESNTLQIITEIYEQ